MYAATAAIQAEDAILTVLFVAGKDMFYAPWGGNGSALEQLYELVDTYHTKILSGTIPIYVEGYCASLPARRENLNTAFVRSNRVKSELIVRKGLKEEHFITKNYAGTYQGQKDVVVVTLRIPSPVEIPEPEPQPVSEPEPVRVPEPVVEPEPEPSVFPAPPARQTGYAPFTIRTNLLYDAFLTPTLGVEWRVNRHVGIKLDGSFAHWGSRHGRVQKMWLLSPEVRWYLLETTPLYVGIGGNIGEANLYKGVANILSKTTGYQGNIYGGGVTAGYQLPLGNCFAIDFNLGLGYTRFTYDTFSLSNGVRVSNGQDLAKNFWGPTQAGISLVWLIK